VFCYDDNSDSGRVWRPDLVPYILRWLDTVSAESKRHLVRLLVSDIGGFVAVFRVGTSPEVYFEFDDSEGMAIRVPAQGWYVLAADILPFEQRQLEIAIQGASHQP
jgi:hypothetical protein